MPKKNKEKATHLFVAKKVEQSISPDISPITTNNKDYQNKVILFVSFDLSGSTDFKPKNLDSWGDTFYDFFEAVARTMTLEYRAATPDIFFTTWKFQGDEILFFAEVSTQEGLVQGVKKTYDVLQERSLAIRKETGGALDVKAAAWIAFIDSTTNRVFYPNDFVENQDTPKYHYPPDFIGTSIDEGFRVAKAFSASCRLAIAFELACCLIETEAYSRIYVVGAQELKGIWNKQPEKKYYPALWYSEEKPVSGDNIWSELQDSRTAMARQPDNSERLEKIFKAVPQNIPYFSNLLRAITFGGGKRTIIEKKLSISQEQSLSQRSLE
jgi:hypothetical protein